MEKDRLRQKSVLLFVFPLLFCALFTFDMAHANFFKWKDREGNVHYADQIHKVPKEFRNQIPGYEDSGANKGNKKAEEESPAVTPVEAEHPEMFMPTPRPKEPSSSFFDPESIMANTGVFEAAGFAAMMAGLIWLIVIAFQESPGWGASCIILPPVTLIYVGMRWEKTKIPFAILAAGFVIIAAGVTIRL